MSNGSFFRRPQSAGRNRQSKTPVTPISGQFQPELLNANIDAIIDDIFKRLVKSENEADGQRLKSRPNSASIRKQKLTAINSDPPGFMRPLKRCTKGSESDNSPGKLRSSDFISNNRHSAGEEVCNNQTNIYLMQNHQSQPGLCSHCGGYNTANKQLKRPSSAGPRRISQTNNLHTEQEETRNRLERPHSASHSGRARNKHNSNQINVDNRNIGPNWPTKTIEIATQQWIDNRKKYHRILRAEEPAINQSEVNLKSEQSPTWPNKSIEQATVQWIQKQYKFRALEQKALSNEVEIGYHTHPSPTVGSGSFPAKISDNQWHPMHLPGIYDSMCDRDLILTVEHCDRCATHQSFR